MRVYFLLSALVAFTHANAAQTHECDAVLIPTIHSFEHDVRTTLDTLSVIQSNSSLEKDKRDNFSVTVPIYGVPVQFGYGSERSSRFLNQTLSYFKQNLTNHEATSYLISDVDNLKVEKWADCMQRGKKFLVYFNKQTITADSATLYVKRDTTGPARNSTVRIIIRGGTIGGKDDIQFTMGFDGDLLYTVNRSPNARVTVEATMDFGDPSTAITPEVVDVPELPEVAIRVTGNLQQAVVDEVFPTGQFNLTVSKGVLFNPNQVSLRLEQIVSGKVCRSKVISSSALGDMMDSVPEWRLDDMKAGCQVPNPGAATVVECFVDPVYFTECR